MSEGDFFVDTEKGVAGSSSSSVTGASSSTGAVEIHTISTTGPCTILSERDTTGDGTYDASFTIEESGSAVHSQKNKIEIDSSEKMRLRILNTSQTQIDVQVTGIEVNS